MRAASRFSLTLTTCIMLAACSSSPVEQTVPEPAPGKIATPSTESESESENQTTNNERDKTECVFERIKGVVEIIEWKENKASLLFYPGETKLTIDRESIEPYIQTGQSEIKALLKKPLNQHCGKSEISFFSSVD